MAFLDVFEEVGSRIGRLVHVEFQRDHAEFADVQFYLRVAHVYFTKVAELIRIGVVGTFSGNGPPAPVDVDLIFVMTSMPLTILPNAT